MVPVVQKRRIGSFHVVVLQRTARKYTKTSNARAELLLCSLNLLFGDVLVAVAIVVCLSSLFIEETKSRCKSFQNHCFMCQSCQTGGAVKLDMLALQIAIGSVEKRDGLSRQT